MINFSELDYKKIILAILIFIVSAVLLFGLIWLIFFRTTNEVEQPGGAVIVAPGGNLPGTEFGEKDNIVGPSGRLTPEDINKTLKNIKESELAKTAQGSLTKVISLVDDKVNEVNINRGGFNFLSGEDNKFYYLSSDGKKILLSDDSFPFVDKVSWSGDGNKVALSYPDGSNILYDFNKKKKKTLPRGAEDFSFDNSSNKLAYKFVNNSSENNWLVVNDIKNNQAIPVEHLGDNGNEVQVDWSPDNQVVALYHESTGLDSEEVIFLGLHDENFRSLKVNGSNFKGKWSPDGERMIYHVISPNNDYNPVLGIADAKGNKIGNHNFILGLSTWVDKCVFSSDSKKVYCAVPINLPTGAGLYPEIVNNSQDVFYEINLNNGISHLIAYPVLSEKLNKFQVNKLFLSEDGDELYFWDNWTDKIYSMRLR